MKVLVIGGGGREHALIWKLHQSPQKPELYCAPGNPGISKLARCVPIQAMELDRLLAFVTDNHIDFTVVGPDDPLGAGIVDLFESEGHKIYGPRKNAAILESSKAFSKGFMKRHNIPTAAYEVFDNYEKAKEYISGCGYPLVIKADGLALGKGVLICQSREEAAAALKNMMVEKQFGASGDTVVIEDFMAGTEVTVLAFCDGKTLKPMISSQDYKKAYDNNEGLNTGGMGSITPAPVYDKNMEKRCEEEIFKPVIAGLQAEGRPFVGTLYFGLMVTAEGPKVVEFNARFGDPETQVILPMLKTDLLDILMKCAEGNLDNTAIEWEDGAAVCVVLASGGYPESYHKGYVISGIENGEKIENVVIFHAGTIIDENSLLTNGGRVLGVVGKGRNMRDAREKAYEAAALIKFKNLQFRTDIGI